MRSPPPFAPTFAALLAIASAACGESTHRPAPAADPGILANVPESARLPLECLQHPVHVLYTEYDFPHLYAEDEQDLACAQGFVTARDRYFEMEMARRFGLGILSELVGDAGLAIDLTSRTIGMRTVAQQLYAGAAPAWRARADAYARGVNAYIAEVRAGRAPPPAELEAAALFLGARGAAELMHDWTGEAAGGVGVVAIYQASHDGADLDLETALASIATWGEDLAERALRHAGAREDLVHRYAPPRPTTSVPPQAGRAAAALRADPRTRANPDPTSSRTSRVMLERARARLAALAPLLHRRANDDVGSNVWAVMPALASDGRALLAFDGHLPLSAPAIFYGTHLDTRHLRGGDVHVIGDTIPGLPLVAVGTNGHLAWGQTVSYLDVVDWYREEVVTDAAGRPRATRFRDADAPLQVIAEHYDVSSALGSTAGPRDIERFATADGRPLFALEGRAVRRPEDDPAAVNVGGEWIVAADTDGDGMITAVSMAYTGLFERYVLDHIGGLERSFDVGALAWHQAGLAAYGANLGAADAAGDVHFSAFEAVPCRTYLPRDARGAPVAGADPTRLIDGTRHPSFHVRFTDDRLVDAAPGDEGACTVAYERVPHVVSPAQGFVVNANNDPAGFTFDDDLWNDGVYVGWAWAVGYRAHRITELIEAGRGRHDVASMAAIQGDHRSALAPDHVPWVLDALAAARAAADAGDATDRAAALYAAHRARLDDATERLTAWADRGYTAASGVRTFYDPGAQSERADAVATMIFHACLGRILARVLGDEMLPPGLPIGGGRDGPARTLDLLMRGRGAQDPLALASWNAATGESIFFDVTGTPEIETSREVIVSALVETYDYLATPPGDDRSGGLGSDDPDDWLWGLKHVVRFDSIVSAFVGSDPRLGLLTDAFALTPARLPLDAEPLAPDDPRHGLQGFPRPGDAFGVDAAGAIAATDFSYRAGPVMRLVVALGAGGVTGVNVLPGGQSGLPDSPHAADQAALWLGNENYPLRFDVDDVVAGAVRREVFAP